MKKKTARILVIAILLLTFAACGNNDYYDYSYPEYIFEDLSSAPEDDTEQDETLLEESSSDENITEESTSDTSFESNVETTDDSYENQTESLTEDITSEAADSSEPCSETVQETTVPETTIESEASETSTIETEEHNAETSTDTSSEITETRTQSVTETESESEYNSESNTEKEPECIHVDVDENYHCDICGIDITAEDDDSSTSEIYQSILFGKFYDANFDLEKKTHSNGSKMEINKSDKYQSDGYELHFVNFSNVYKNARDAQGNPTLKLGKTSEVASFEFTVPNDIKVVVIKVAKYCGINSVVEVNNREYVLTRSSDDGEYDSIIIDTSKNKTIIFSTTEAGPRCMIRSIEFVK